jgi:hypothetical protein
MKCANQTRLKEFQDVSMYQQVNSHRRGLAVMLALMAIRPASANLEPAISLPPDSGVVTVAVDAFGKIWLEAREVGFGRVLDALSASLHTPIRYANAPQQPVSATCQGGLDKVLRCLLGENADLVFSYRGSVKRAGTKPIASVKVLASTFTEFSPVSPSTDAAGAPAPVRPVEAAVQGNAPETLEALLAMTRSADPEQRAVGLEKLRRTPGVDDASLKAAYQSALTDADGDVRAEAISGLALLDEDNSFGMLSSAMDDEHPSVRLAALDGMPVNRESRPYYEKALTDADESVRELAALRLGIE